jgi:C4-dicarboxylate-specific signal transduction histidine kinase
VFERRRRRLAEIDSRRNLAALAHLDRRAAMGELATSLAHELNQGDRIHLQQVLLNLLMNAMDAVAAMPSERRRVRVTTTQSDGAVRLAVSDTGPGIPADRLTTIFEPFYTTKSSGSGMGMGLAIARGIVEAHNGRMAAENNSTGGATIWVSLPIPSHQSAIAGSSSPRYASET